jgi:hypothetical protein
VRLWRKRLARLVVGLPDQLRRPARNKPKTPSIAKSTTLRAFFDTIDPTRTSPVDARALPPCQGRPGKMPT